MANEGERSTGVKRVPWPAVVVMALVIVLVAAFAGWNGWFAGLKQLASPPKATVADCKPVVKPAPKPVAKRPVQAVVRPPCNCQLPAVAAVPVPAPPPPPAPTPAVQTPPLGPTVIQANIVIDDGSGQLNPPVQGPQLGALVRNGMAAGTILAPVLRQPSNFIFVVDVGGKQYTGTAQPLQWRMDDGRVVQALQARVEVDTEMALAHRGLIRSWVVMPSGEAVRFLNPPDNGIYQSLPDELAKLTQARRAAMFHFVLPRR